MFKTIILYLEVIIILGVPVFLMGTNPSVLASRQFMTVIGAFYCWGVLRHYNAKFADIGLTLRNFRQALVNLITPSLVIIAFAMAVMYVASDMQRIWLIGTDTLKYSPMWSRLSVYIFISAPLQELIFRGYFTYRLEKIVKNNHWLLTLSILVFTLAHVPFRSPLMVLVALFMGITYIFNYQKYRNLLAITVSHAVVGAILMIVRNFYLPYT